MVTTDTVISDSVLFIKERLKANITDPLNRTDGVGFILTGYPKRVTKYPVITIRKANLELGQRLGMGREAYYATVELEIRIWATNEIQRDSLTQKVLTFLNSNQLPKTTSNTNTNVNLHDMKILAAVNVDDMNSEAGTLSCVITLQYRFLYGLD